MYEPMSILAGTAAVTGAFAIGNALFNQPSPPTISPPPAPSSYNSYEYDDEGNVVSGGSQVWDAATNSYIYKPRELTADEKAELSTKKEIKTKLLDALNKTPEEWTKAADDYAKTFASQMQKTYDERFNKYAQSERERLSGQGLFGSKAYADIEADLARQKSEADVDISEKSAMAGEGLLETYRGRTLNELNAVESNLASKDVLAMQRANQAANIANAGTASRMGAYTAESSNMLNEWNTKYLMNRDRTNLARDTSMGLAFLYGYGGKGGGTTWKDLYGGSFNPQTGLPTYNR